MNNNKVQEFQDDPCPVICMIPTFKHLTHLLAFMYAIEEINNSTELLPNITLGYHIYDACTSEAIALMSTLSLLSEEETPALNYICQPDQKLVAFVGHLLSSTTYTIAEITQLYGYPQISYGALDPVFNDRAHFPSVYRTVPNEYSQFRVIIKLLNHFGWTWVGIIASDDESNRQASEELRKEMGRNGICVDFLKAISSSSDILEKSAIEAIETIKRSSVRVIILYCKTHYLMAFLFAQTSYQMSERVFICSVALNIVTELNFNKFLYSMNGSFLISLPKENIQGLNNFFSHRLMTDMNKNIFVNRFFGFSTKCAYGQSDDVIISPSCLKYDVIKEHLLREETINHRIKHTIYMAVYALAHALDNMQLSREFLEMSSKEKISKMRLETPTSVCMEPCSSGHRRAHQNGRPKCCFDCIPCSEGEISNYTDVENCVKCAEDQWPNPAKDQCIKRVIDFLSYGDLLGYILSGCASVFTVLTAAVFLVFIKHRRTPIVRANNQNISYILLMALLMSFLCSFIFIGQPTGVTCLLRQTTFVFVFSVAISSVLGKTIMVLIAFKATKIEKKFRMLGGINISLGLVFICSFGEFVLCVIWLIINPPHVESDNKTVPGKTILQCNEGSIISFYLAVSYIGVLSLISFAVAFIARKLPDRFNEAQHITFSMLVFCSVWASFIPTYLSTKGKHMVAVEIFAIQASAAGMLMCIFTPKCYIILLQPELNGSLDAIGGVIMLKADWHLQITNIFLENFL
ncbi:hypothetical protein XENTR_v10022126 [Xenopus tropicalis]|nr:hypothetical protein XENTR_v10022126 [Xenopus tropicalis]